MCDCRHRDPFATPTACAALAPRQTDGVEARTQYDRPGDEREETDGQSLHSLQECICELLIRNQELRMSLLESATNYQSREPDPMNAAHSSENIDSNCRSFPLGPPT